MAARESLGWIVLVLVAHILLLSAACYLAHRVLGVGHYEQPVHAENNRKLNRPSKYDLVMDTNTAVPACHACTAPRHAGYPLIDLTRTSVICADQTQSPLGDEHATAALARHVVAEHPSGPAVSRHDPAAAAVVAVELVQNENVTSMTAAYYARVDRISISMLLLLLSLLLLLLPLLLLQSRAHRLLQHHEAEVIS